MPNDYRMPEWKEFRAEMLERDGYMCTRCGRGAADEVILQVHHRRYIAGRRPWEYPYDDCETLCRGCHGAEHGLVRPSIGWECFGDEDLGDLCGRCELCGTELRYVFFVFHPHWEPMEVGTICCDYLTGTEIASAKMESINRFRSRLHRFISSARWKNADGVPTIRQKRINVKIHSTRDGFVLCLNGIAGKRCHATIDDAKRAAFEFIDSGKADTFFRPRRRRTGFQGDGSVTGGTA